jgi:uncharacterized membrane protein
VSHLVAIAYPDEQRASEVLDVVERLEAEGTIDLHDAVAVAKDSLGGIKLAKVLSRVAAGAALGAFWGALVGLVFFMPAVGAVFGAAGGALVGKLAGVSRANEFGDFGLHINEHMPPGSSAILMLVKSGDPEQAIAALQPYGGTVLRTTLPDEVEVQLRDALSQIAAEPA